MTTLKSHRRAAAASLGLLVTSILVTPMVVNAAEPISAFLTSDSETIPVLIPGGGNAFHVIGSTTNFVVKYAVRNDGLVVVNSPGQQDRDLVEYTLTSPSFLDGRYYLVRGFFTPQR